MIKYPIAVFLTKKNGKRVVWTFLDEKSLSFQLNYWLRGWLRKVDVIDAEGNLYCDVTIKAYGVNTGVYLQSNLILGHVVLIVSFVFLSVMVKFEIKDKEVHSNLSLIQVKNKMREILLESEGFYTFCPVDEIISRVMAAKTIKAMFSNFVHD